MNRAASKAGTPTPPAASAGDGAHAIPTFVAADLLERLIVDRDARAVDRVVTAARRAPVH